MADNVVIASSLALIAWLGQRTEPLGCKLWLAGVQAAPLALDHEHRQ